MVFEKLIFAALVTLIVYFLIVVNKNDKLAKFPGPRLASWSSLWIVWYFHRSNNKEPLRSLHRKYGKVVRIGPNKLSFGRFEAAKDVYSVSQNLQKSDWYLAQSPTANGYVVANMFSTQDVKYHDSIRRLVNKPFNMAAVPLYESRIMQVVEEFISEVTQRFADKGAVFDLCKWVQYFALDAISNIAFSKSYGFLKSDTDVANLMSDNRFFLKYSHYIGQAPWLDRFLFKNPLLLWLNRHGIALYEPGAVHFARNLQTQRVKELEDGADPQNNIMDKLLDLKNISPDIMNEEEVTKMLLTVVFAGGDTTASLIVAILRYLLIHPSVYSKLQAEIDKLVMTDFSYTSPQNSPYLDSVIKETARVFPVLRIGSERMTPPSGMVIDGIEIPGNANISVNPWVSHYDTSMWGIDADVFRPERWMEFDMETNRRMTKSLLLFGMGKYQCLGINIAYAEIYKFIPACLKAFRLELEDPAADWTWEEGLIVFVRGLNVRVSL